MPTRALCWIRRDLRLSDHRPLELATSLADEVAVVFVFDPKILDLLEDRDDKRVAFIQRSLLELDEQLAKRGSRLVVRRGDPVVEIPKVAKEFGASFVVAGKDYETYAIRRDAAVARVLDLRLVKDQVVLEGAEVLSKEGAPFRVFTPFSKAWLARLNPELDLAKARPNPDHLAPASALEKLCQPYSLPELGFQETDLWLEPGEAAAAHRLKAFMPKAGDYGSLRDFPAIPATSGLSVHLRFGTISARAAVRAAMEGGEDARKWLSELIWREFYSSILQHFPEVETEAFQSRYTGLDWPGDPEHLAAWKEGRTGYPIVDAAMRDLNATGWMHNRLRMVCASFLTKDLLIDWREGEAYFARRLLDFDLASNNGGWQWAASTGADPQPYFRIFNPILQSRKFDAKGEYIRRWVPELASAPDSWIHAPWEAGPLELSAAEIELGKTYPAPIVDHDRQRPLAIKLLESAAKG